MAPKRTPKRHIEVIRQEMTGSPRLIKSLREACELLSAGLYRENCHFFLELLQNADDNDYADGVAPSIVFERFADRIQVHTNEIGFTPKNVDSLCAIGDSSKIEQKTDRIGEKGVGFKALFKVTRRVEIHSSGYHFCFDLDGDELGMLVPTWIDDESTRITTAGTTFVVHLTPAARASLDLEEYLKPDLLIFLRRLRSIAVVDHRTDETMTMIRSDRDPWTTITIARRGTTGESTTTHRFFRHHRNFKVGVAEPKRSGIDSSTACVAFPAGERDRAAASTPRHIYAFLPIRSTSLTIVGHADFVLTASRESIIEDRPWNLRLRDELAATLVEGILATQSTPGLNLTCLAFLNGTPNAGVDGFLHTLIAKAETQLARESCVPLAGGAWGTPGHCLLRDSHGIHKLLDEDAYSNILQKRLAEEVNPSVATVLGRLKCQTLTVEDLVRCCENAPWVAKKMKSIEWARQLFELISRLELAPPLLERLRACPVLPLIGGQSTAVQSHTVFLNLSEDAGYGFEDELRVIDPRLLSGEPSIAESVTGALFRFGVQRADPELIITKHILHKHGERPLKSPKAAMLGHARYVRDHFDDLSKETRAAVANGLIIHSTTGKDGNSYYRTARNLYLGGAYEDPHGAVELLGDHIVGHQISPDYIAGKTKAAKKEDADAWSRFFRQLGVAVLPRITSSNGDWIPSSEFEKLIDDVDAARRAKFLEILDAVWDTTDYAARARTRLNTTSAFVTRLRGLAVATSRGPAVPVGQCYRRTRDNEEVFGDGVPYLRHELKSEKLVAALGIVTAPSLNQALQRLKELAAGPCEKSAVEPLYRFIERRFSEQPDLVRERFESGKLVWIKSDTGNFWRALSACCWDVPREFVPFAPIVPLKYSWSNFESFFGEGQLKAQRRLTAAQWVAVLESLRDQSSRAANFDGDRRRRLALEVYVKLNDALDRGKSHSPPPWVAQFGRSRLLLIPGGQWRTAETVVVPDDEAITRLFAGRPGLEFLDVPTSDVQSLRNLLVAMGVKFLSKTVVVIPPTHERTRRDERLERAVRSSVLGVARFQFHKNKGNYDRLWRDGRFAKLANIDVLACDPLRVTIRLGAVTVDSAFEARIVGDASWTLYRAEDCSDIGDAVAIEVSRVLELEDGLIKTAITTTEPEGMTRYFERRNIPELPERERARFAEFGLLSGVPGEDGEAECPCPETVGAKPPSATVVRSSSPTAVVILPAADPDAGTPPARAYFPTPMTLDGPAIHWNGTRSPESNGHSANGDFHSNGDLFCPAPDADGHQRLRTSHSAGRLVSFIHSDPTPTEANTDVAKAATELTDRAVQFVISEEASRGRRATDVRATRPGCSVESVADGDASPRSIVVKALEGPWGERGVSLTPSEFEWFRTTRQPGHLYVVEHAGDPRQRVLQLENPVQRITRFAFDEGWRALAIVPADTRVEIGAPFTTESGRGGTIHAVSTYGKLWEIEIKLADGSIETETVSEATAYTRIRGGS
jgi:hypothetical protein